MTVTLHHGDIPAGLDFGTSVAIDTETMGLKPVRDRLCVVQLSAGDGTAHIVQLKSDEYAAPNLKKLLTDPNVVNRRFRRTGPTPASWSRADLVIALSRRVRWYVTAKRWASSRMYCSNFNPR